MTDDTQQLLILAVAGLVFTLLLTKGCEIDRNHDLAMKKLKVECSSE